MHHVSAFDAKDSGRLAVVAGHSALFVPAAQMLLDLDAQNIARSSSTACVITEARCCAASTMIGCLSFENRNAGLLLGVASRPAPGPIAHRRQSSRRS
jgi:hypothetical protein